jgi:hypothetical protein
MLLLRDEIVMMAGLFQEIPGIWQKTTNVRTVTLGVNASHGRGSDAETPELAATCWHLEVHATTSG